MARGRCPNCGATIDLVEVSGEMVPLDIFEDHGSDAPHFVITNHDPLRAERVMGESVRGQPDHRYDCPAYAAGRA